MTESPQERRIARGFSYLAAGALAVAGLFPVSNPDTFGHLAQGRQIAELGYVPPVDTWSLFPGPPRPWHNYEWLSDLLYYGLYAALGYDGLLAFKCVLLASTTLLLLSLAQTLAGSRAVVLSALVLISAIPAVRIRLSDRPHMIGLCLAAMYMVALTRMAVRTEPVPPRTRRLWLAGMFALHVVWVNVHGSHLLGFAIAGAFAVLGPRARRREFFTLLGLFVLASCISPYGPLIVTDAIAHIFDPRYRALISEWQPWREDDPPWLQLGPAFQGALLTLVAPRLMRASAGTRPALSVALLLGVASFRSIRFIAEFMLLTAPLVGAGYAQLLGTEGRVVRVLSRRFHAATFSALAVLSWLVPWGAHAVMPHISFGHGVSYAGLPRGPGVLLARARIPPRVFAAMEHSWPLMWETPKARFFLDGRVPFYGPEHVELFKQTQVDERLFATVLREYDINAVVLRHTFAWDRPRMAVMARKPNWDIVLIDDAFVVYTREDLTRASGFAPLKHVLPDYSPKWVIDATPEERANITEELSRLREVGTAQSYRHWVLALLELQPLARDGANAGFRWPEHADDWARYKQAAEHLAIASKEVGDLPIVGSLRALVQAILCDFEGADASLALASSRAELAREGLFASQELALRKGERASVEKFVKAARELPEARDDMWLKALARGLDAPPSCPK